MALTAPARRLLRIVFTFLALVAAVWGYWQIAPSLGYSPWLNEDLVAPGRLVRSGQPRIHNMDGLLETYGIRTIFCLSGQEQDDIRSWAMAHHVAILCIKMKADIPPTESQIGLFFDVMDDHPIALAAWSDVITDQAGLGDLEHFQPGYPVLIHCLGGADRTGAMVALYQMAFQGWTWARARQDMLFHFHIPFNHPAQFEFLEDVAPRIHRDHGTRAIPLPEPR